MSVVLKFKGPQLVYQVQVSQREDALIEVVHGNARMQWSVEVIEVGTTASGLTYGTKPIWGEVFWFELIVGSPARIDYYGNGALIRSDTEVIG